MEEPSEADWQVEAKRRELFGAFPILLNRSEGRNSVASEGGPLLSFRRMLTLSHLFKNNRDWAERVLAGDPDFFLRLSKMQAPNYLWIGCSDSRVPANQIVGLLPGELFVHRNIANLAVNTDINMLSVLQYAVEVLRVSDVIVCGHYGCGGIRAVINGLNLGLTDNWLRHVRDIYNKHRTTLEAERNDERRSDRLCELNVFEQVRNVAHTTIIQKAWAEGRTVTVHGWVYSIQDGLLRDLGVGIHDPLQLEGEYRLPHRYSPGNGHNGNGHGGHGQ